MSPWRWRLAYVAAGWFAYNFLLILALEGKETFALMFQKLSWFFNTFVCMADNPIFLIVNIAYIAWAVTWLRTEYRHLHNDREGHAA